ncbi:MAG TPA: hypothetical protein VKY92_00555 [Verrucomicrobiae bacterium]|nr:hypothetical protein [Verrucomicrobiae bacterium]
MKTLIALVALLGLAARHASQASGTIPDSAVAGARKCRVADHGEKIDALRDWNADPDRWGNI